MGTAAVRRTAAKPLTERTILTLKPGRKRSDGRITPGHGRLIVVARQLGGSVERAFYFRYQAPNGGAERSMRLGVHGTTTLEQARAGARAAQDLLRQGIDPKVHRETMRERNRRAEREADLAREFAARQGTLQDLIDTYVQHLRAQHKQSADDTERTLRRHVSQPFSRKVACAASTIEPADISEILALMLSKGIGRRTNIVRAMLRAAFAYGAALDHDPRQRAKAMAQDQAPKVFNLASNPAAVLPPMGEFDRAGERTLTDKELREYWTALAGLHPAVGAFLKAALLLGGQRMSQLKRLRWAEYSEHDATVALRDPKGRGATREHLLPVSGLVREILGAMRQISGDGEFVFSTTRGKKQIDLSTLSAAVVDIGRDCAQAMREQQGIDVTPFTAKDIRRTVETRMAALRISKEIRAQVLSHGRESGVQAKHYDRHDYLPEKSAALAKWEHHLAQVLDGTAPKVVRGFFPEVREADAA